jgi:hypothetical protein
VVVAVIDGIELDGDGVDIAAFGQGPKLPDMVQQLVGAQLDIGNVR